MGIYKTISSCAFNDPTLITTSTDKKDLIVSPPPEFGGPKDIWSPEDIFTASISSCYILTFRSITRFKKLEWENINVTVEANLEKTSSGLKFTEVDIFPRVEVCCNSNLDEVLKALYSAKDNCLVTKSMNCNFNLHPKVINKFKEIK